MVSGDCFFPHFRGRCRAFVPLCPMRIDFTVPLFFFSSRLFTRRLLFPLTHPPLASLSSSVLLFFFRAPFGIVRATLLEFYWIAATAFIKLDVAN